MRTSALLFCIGFCASALASDSLNDAISLYEQGAFDKAEQALEELKDADETAAEAHYYLGLILQSRGEFLDAAEQFEKAIERDDGQSRYYQGLGEAYGSATQELSFFKQMRLAGKIRDAFERAVELDPENIDARAGLATYYINAPGVAGGSEEKALEQAEEIARRDPYRGHMIRAAVFQSRNDEEAVEREYRAAIEASPDQASAYQALGIFLTSKERFKEAIEVYDRALEHVPDAMGVTYQLGRTASISGQFLERGEAAFIRYLEYQPTPDEPGLDWAHYRLGLIHQLQGRTEDARAQFEQALQLNPDHEEARKALKKL
ncbi:MAG: tetratricopeptide repeat protein [Xanthomonadales bacterium]|nr:tetratricopeptide repeat protein [Xanthomonadales bacterium]